MKFGIFDHVDVSHLPQAEHYETRLKLVEALDRLGFDSYHTAEHHGTELGLAPSANVYLSAVCQRTKRLKFGPLVYLPALYHPMRLAQEICMLDQMSRGRFQIGVGSGAVWIEQKIMDVDPDTIRERFVENRDIILQALTTDDEVTHHGKYYNIEGFPMVLKTYQKPYPPIWYGLSNPGSAGWGAEHDANVVSMMPAASAKGAFDRFKEEWDKLGKSSQDLPVMGLNRHMVVADTDADAMRIAKSAFARWRASFSWLWDRKGIPFPFPYPKTWEEYLAAGLGMAGTPKTIRDYLAREVETAGANAVIGQMIFGTMQYDDALRSLELFAGDVMPALKKETATA